MKKGQKFQILLLITFLVIFSFAYVKLKNDNKTKEETTSSESESIIKISDDDIVGISYTNNNSTIDLEKEDTTWYYSGDKNFPLVQSYPQNIVSSICSLIPERKIEDSLDNSSEYGLDTPNLQVTVKDINGNKTTIYIGDCNSSSNNYYCYIEGTSIIYTIDSSLEQSISYSLYDMVEMDSLPTLVSSNFTEVTIGSKKYVYFSEGNEKYDYTNSVKWFQELQDGTYKSVDSTEFSTLLTNITSVTYKSCVDYNASSEKISECGFDNPIIINVKYTETDSSGNAENKELVLLVGNKNDDGDYYVKNNDTTKIYIVSKDIIDGIVNVDDESLINKDAFAIPKTSTNSLVINVNGNECKIIENDELTDDKYDSLYSLISTCSAEKTKNDIQLTNNEPEVTLTYVLNNDSFKNVEIKLIKYDANYYAAQINGVTQHLINKNTVNNIISKFNSSCNE